MWLFLALTGHTLNALGFLGDKLFVEKLVPNPKKLAFYSGIGSGIYFILFPWFLKFSNGYYITAALGSGIVGTFSLFYFYRAVDKDEVSRVIPSIGAIVPLITFALSYWILNERLGEKTLMGFGMLVLGAIIIEWRFFSSKIKLRRFDLIFLEIWTAFLFALAAVLMKYSFGGENDLSSFLWSRLGAFSAALLFLLFTQVRESLIFSGKGGGKMDFIFILTRGLSGIAALILWVAIAQGSVTVVSGLQGTQYPVLFLSALFISWRWPKIFQEEMGTKIILQKILGLFLIAGAIALLAVNP